ncbi:MAG: AAA family ATPase [Minisyncoccales bacterium]|jgi:ATP-dependent Clp protease ATP-binding subunit ClpC
MRDSYKIDLRKTKIFTAVKTLENPFFRKAKALSRIFSFLFFVGATLSFLLVAEMIGLTISPEKMIGLTFFFFGSALLFWQIDAFIESKLKHPDIIKAAEAMEMDDYNIAQLFSFKVADAFYQSKGESIDIFLYHLFNDIDFNFIFSRMGIDFVSLKKQLKEFKRSEESKEILYKVINRSLLETADRGGKRIKKNDVLVAAFQEYSLIKDVFADKGANADDIRNISNWIYKLRIKEDEDKRFWEWKNLVKKGSLAKDWASGYTILLDQYSHDWTKSFRRVGFPEIIGRDKEAAAMERILSREKKSNIMIVGEPGVGRKSSIQEIAKRSFYGESLPEMNHKRIVEIDMSFLLANIQDWGETEEVLDRIFSEVAESGNTILVIPEIHNFIGVELAPGRVDISGILLSYLSFPQFKIIGITDYAGYRRMITNSSIGALFEKIEIKEMKNEDVIRHLQNVSLELESRHKKMILYPALKEIVNYCSRYFPEKPFPEKAVDLLNEAMTYLIQKKERILLPEHIAKLVTRKTDIPVGAIEDKEKEILLNLEDLIHQKVINQEEAVREVSSALRRSRSEIASTSKPMGTFLFLGPTGVGKTETAKALAEIYFSSSNKMIRVDMSEFQNLSDIDRLIGAHGHEGFLTTQVRENPFSLILLDELEKAHPDLLNLFLQVLDEGHLTDGAGRRVDFKSSIIIATSNAGSQMILESIKRELNWDELKNKLLDRLFSEAVFRPEFINRFDAVVLFSPLSKENLMDISELLLNKTIKKLKEKNIKFVVTNELKEKMVELGYNPSFGAREMKRVIQDKVENPIASALISGELDKGVSFTIDTQDFSVKFL